MLQAPRLQEAAVEDRVHVAMRRVDGTPSSQYSQYDLPQGTASGDHGIGGEGEGGVRGVRAKGGGG
jgi:hypothetical protein